MFDWVSTPKSLLIADLIASCEIERERGRDGLREASQDSKRTRLSRCVVGTVYFNSGGSGLGFQANGRLRKLQA